MFRILKTVFWIGSLCFTLAACDRGAPPPKPMTSQEAQGMVANGFGVIIDIREPDWRNGLLAKAKGKEAILCCGPDAKAAAEETSKLGIKSWYVE